MRDARWLIVGAAVLIAAWGCSGGIETNGTTGSGAGATGGGASSSSVTTSGGGMGGATATSSSAGGASTSSSTSGSTSSTGAGGGVSMASCSMDPPPGAPAPLPPKAYSGGTCPALVQGYNTLKSSGNDRQFILAIPANLMPGEKVPVLFLWHWLKGSPDDFYTKGEVQAAVDQQRFVAVLPKSKGDLFFEWPFNVADSQARMDEELTYFDDMLACVSQQFNANLGCVSTVGVSAGALFTDQLAGARSEYLSSFVSLSGGVDGLIRPWGNPTHRLPGLVLWGGPTDICVVINFETGSKALEMVLGQDGNFFLECIHNCGHSEPPFDAPPGMSKYAGMWQFVFDHPFWLPAGASPYYTNGLPVGMPEWCGIGPGSATPRTGPCAGGGC